jgi:hypothetical protein
VLVICTGSAACKKLSRFPSSSFPYRTELRKDSPAEGRGKGEVALDTSSTMHARLSASRPNAAKLAILCRSGRVPGPMCLGPVGCGGGWSAGAARRPSN